MRQSLSLTLSAAFVAGLLTVFATAQIPIDLRTWTAESYPAVGGFGNGVWNVSPDGSTVTQTVNGQPTFFYSPFIVGNVRLEGRIRITSGSDDDYVGFAIGLRPGDTTNPNADYLLIDWKRGTQSYNFGAPACTPGTTAQQGLAVSRVHGIPTADELWGHVNLDVAPCSGPNDRVDELVRATTLGATGWNRNQDYVFAFEFTPTGLDVYVDTVLEASVPGSFAIGRMAFYNFSQGGVVYSAFTVSCTASSTNYGTGFPGTSGVPTLISSTPLLGSTVTIQGSNVAGVPSAGVLIYGFAPADFPSGFGGRIMVDPIVFETHPFPLSGMTHSLVVPTDLSICGQSVFLQQVHLDVGAAQSFAFSPGLHLVLGT